MTVYILSFSFCAFFFLSFYVSGPPCFVTLEVNVYYVISSIGVCSPNHLVIHNLISFPFVIIVESSDWLPFNFPYQIGPFLWWHLMAKVGTILPIMTTSHSFFYFSCIILNFGELVLHNINNITYWCSISDWNFQ